MTSEVSNQHVCRQSAVASGCRKDSHGRGLRRRDIDAFGDRSILAGNDVGELAWQVRIRFVESELPAVLLEHLQRERIDTE